MSYIHIQTTSPKARKDHPCIWCTEPIAKGSAYKRVVGTWEGQIQTSLFHPECAEACQKFLRDNRADEFDPHEFKRGSTEEAP